ncbi:hypothetical protein GBA63_02235 [Rubrobacter tropicus]|uniref:Uncharacterized protein n=1 Tax=Rubrobacter tropicus TaxID=2653851 RepID=A0A6G8Q534_9ACTN|nr:hypothetical protein [Rubrobacter tropicus]QIN81576.1 hypothetical protein GBA63_02235 [Rubrobacter tropicus]
MTIAAVVFGILGIWITALNPLKVFRSDAPTGESEQELINDLQPFFIVSLFAFSAVVVLRLLVFVIPPTADSVGMLVEALVERANGGKDYVFEFPAALGTAAKVLAGVVTVFLFLVEAVLVIVNLKPLFEANKEQVNQNIERSKGSNKRK